MKRIVEWNQKTHLPAGSEGICSALVYEWIWHMATPGKSHLTFFSQVSTTEGLKHPTLVSKLQLKQPLAGGEDLESRGLTFASMSNTTFGVVKAQNKDQDAAVQPGRWVITFSFRSSKGTDYSHSIGVDSFALMAFDPNVGLIQCDSPQDLHDAILKLVSKYKPRDTDEVIYENFLNIDGKMISASYTSSSSLVSSI